MSEPFAHLGIPVDVPAWPLLELGTFYSRSWAAVDFFLFFALFTGVARATVGRRLGGREGQLVSIALGAMLAVAALGLEFALGVNLTAFGGVAVTVLVLVVGVVVFQILRTVGLGLGSAMAISVLALGLGSSAIRPDGVIADLVFLIQLAAFIALGYLGFRAVSAIGQHSSGRRLRQFADHIEEGTVDGYRSTPYCVGARPLGDQLQRAWRTITRRLRPSTEKAQKDSGQILKELRFVRELLSHEALTDEDRRKIATTLRRVPHERHRLRVDLDRVRRLDRSLLRFDVEACEELRKRVAGLSPNEQGRLAQLIVEERDKIRIGERIERAERFIRGYDANAANSLEKAAEELTQARLLEARQSIEVAIRYEEEAIAMVIRLERVEDMLLRLTRLEIKEVTRGT